MFVGTLDQVSNKGTWIALYELTDGDTGELIDLGSVDEITIQIRGNGITLTETLTGGGVEIVDTGVFKWTFSKADMGSLCASKTYEVGCVLEGDGEAVQLIIGQLPVLDGIVR